MRKILLVVLIVNCFYSFAFSQCSVPTPRFDERTELLSIVFRLSEAREYMNNSVKKYTDAIDSYFNKYKDHEVVNMAKKLRKKNGVSYDAVMSMALHLRISNNSVGFDDSKTKRYLDDRWGKYADSFVVFLDDFYRVSRFNDFFNRNKDIYDIAIKRFSKVSNSVNLDWYKSFFGEEPKGGFHIILSLNNFGNYGPKVEDISGKENVFSILCARKVDGNGDPVYNMNRNEILIHEFCHSFCNSLGEKYYQQMKTRAEEFFSLVSRNMRRQAYCSELTMINEILVRASTIKYFKDNGATKEKIDRMLLHEVANGFLWIEDLYESLNKYGVNRELYPTLDDYMPEIVKLQDSFNPKDLYKEFQNHCPRIVYSSIVNNATEVDPEIKEIIIEYDRPMSSYGISNKGDHPETKVEWKNDKRTKLCVSVNLDKNRRYTLDFNKYFNYDKYGFPLLDSYVLRFKTQR